jgi:hypothetical protein
VWLSLRERAAALLVLVIVAAANRESAAFGGILWLAIMVSRYGPSLRNWRKFLPGFIFMATAAVVVVGLRYGLARHYNPQQVLGLVEVIRGWRDLLYFTGQVPMLICTVVLFVAVLQVLPRPWSRDQRALLVAAVVCSVITLIFGILIELRIWLPIFVILSLLFILGDKKKTDAEWLSGLLRTGKS